METSEAGLQRLDAESQSLDAGSQRPDTASERAVGRPVPAGACIRVLAGFYEGLELPIDREWLVLGRGRNAEMMLAEPTLSRAHAAVGYDGGGYFVQDLRSTNGTLVNGERRERAQLRDGDEIQIGRMHLLVRLPG